MPSALVLGVYLVFYVSDSFDLPTGRTYFKTYGLRETALVRYVSYHCAVDRRSDKICGSKNIGMPIFRCPPPACRGFLIT